jgi:hypothetical protein
VGEGLRGHESRSVSVAKDQGSLIPPVRYAFRSFDRQWLIPDNRLINRPNPSLWTNYSKAQIFLTAFTRDSPTSGPALTVAALMPDLHHYKGSFGGRAFPLWADAGAKRSNVQPGVLTKLAATYAASISGADVVAYIVALTAHPAYISRHGADLRQPGLRIPFTVSHDLFKEAVELGAEVIWLHTFGERFVCPKQERPASPPRLPAGERPTISTAGTIPSAADQMPSSISYDAANRRLHVGAGYVDNVPPEVWAYEVSGKQVLLQWFSYRGADRSRPLMGDRRPPSPLGDIQPDGWLAEYTTELLNLLNVLGRLVKLEPRQADLLKRISAENVIPLEALQSAIKAEFVAAPKIKARNDKQGELLGD